MTVDQATRALLDGFVASGRRPLADSDPLEARAASAASVSRLPPGPSSASARDTTALLEGHAGVPVRVITPPGPSRGVLVWFHGGGWVTGSIDHVDAVGRWLAVLGELTVVLPDYRLAPEHRFPAALDDARAATAWAAETLAIPPDIPLVVGGDSAGGNLAAVVVQADSVCEAPVVAAQALVYPVLSADLDTESFLRPENQHLLDRRAMRWSLEHYLPAEVSPQDADVSPLLAPELGLMPPTVVISAEFDVLNDQIDEYVARLDSAGVSVEHHRLAGQIHGFFTLPGVLPASADALTLLAERIDSLI